MTTLRGNWNYPTSIKFGAGRIIELPAHCRALGMQRPLLVTDAGLAAGSYYYRVTAEDAAGNVGPASNQANVTVTTAPPAVISSARVSATPSVARRASTRRRATSRTSRRPMTSYSSVSKQKPFRHLTS